MSNKQTTLKEVTQGTIFLYCIPEFARGIFMVMVTNYLIYFYQPSPESGLPNLITQGFVVLGILTLIGFVKAIGHVIDAVTDPIIANLSDKCRSKAGRRMPFMKYSAIPYALSALLIFCAPNDQPTILNNIWVAVFIWAYFIFYTFYMIPHVALLPEMVREQHKRVNSYTISSFLYVTGSAVGYATPSIVAGFKHAGLAPLTAWRVTFAIFTAVGVVLLLLPTFFIREKDYVSSVVPTVPLL
ncbi:MAG: MFS transporter, partial [Angelakisella sp.]